MRPNNCESLDIMLVGCVKRKRDLPSQARDLYISTTWKYRRQYAELHRRPWFILSAKHGLLEPDSWIEPYDLALSDFSAFERREWSKRVSVDLIARFQDLAGKTIEIHVGKDYAEHGLAQGLRDAGAIVRRPLAHVVGPGRQFNWYRIHVESCPGNDRGNQCGIPSEFLKRPKSLR